MFDECFKQRQIVMITSRGTSRDGENEKDNVTPIRYHMPCGNYYAIALLKSSYSFELIDKSHSFVVNFIEQMDEAIEYCGSRSGKSIHKLKECGLEVEEADSVDCARLVKAVGFIECHVTNRVDVGEYELIVGKIQHQALK